jgi:hypothetical protein
MIDDVDYLIKNAERDSQIVYIDSSLRNKLFYPNSNEYTIDFDQPFKLVYGFDVLDASVPVTMYNVDKYNNTIYYSVVKNNPTALTPINSEDYLKEVIGCASFADVYEQDYETFVAVGEISILSGFIPAVKVPDKQYIMYMRDVLNTIEIQKWSTQAVEDFFTFSFNNVSYCIKNIPENQDVISKIASKEYSLKFNNDGSVDIIYFVKQVIDFDTFNSIKVSNAFIIVISNYIRSLEVGNYDVLTIVNDLNDLMNPEIDVLPTTTVPKKQGKLQFESASLFLLNSAKGDLIKSLGFDTYPLAAGSSAYNGWTIGSNFLIFGGVYNAATMKYTIISPGLISLLGERFAVLRIKEIEDHLLGSYSYVRMTPGIGMFKMAAAFGGVTNLRFDYTTVLRKPFHPIGKLPKLSIRFETSSGRLYDFKGVNHQLMVNIKFYVPTQKVPFTRSILNPNYNPDLMNYMLENRTIQYHEDSDREDQAGDGGGVRVDEDEYVTYKKTMEQYDYSSSDDSEGDDDDDSEIDLGVRL